MVDTRAVSTKITAARAQARGFWLIVAACLLIHLFPVLHHSNQLQFEQARPGKHFTILGDWNSNTHDSGAIVPGRRLLGPENIYSEKILFLTARQSDSRVALAYRATGPPRAA